MPTGELQIGLVNVIISEENLLRWDELGGDYWAIFSNAVDFVEHFVNGSWLFMVWDDFFTQKFGFYVNFKYFSAHLLHSCCHLGCCEDHLEILKKKWENLD